MEKGERSFIEIANNYTPLQRVVRVFTASLFLIAASSSDEPVIRIADLNGALKVNANEAVRMRNDTDLTLCTARSTLPDFRNIADVQRFMTESIAQGGAMHPRTTRVEAGYGSTIGWGPC